LADRSIPYCGPVPSPETLLQSWNLDPLLLACLTFAASVGALALSRAQADNRRQGAFALAVGGAVLAFVTPLCALTVALFAARSLHHLVLLVVIAPALAVALPLPRVPLGVAFLGASAALLAWHIPAVYSAAWDSAGIYWLMQAALLLPAWGFWSAVRASSGDMAAGMAAALSIAGLAGQMGLIGAILTFAPRPLYPEHLVGSEAFGLGLLADQQLAGLVMWVPGMVPLGVLGAFVLRRCWRHGMTA
jgi:putative membrane protein